MSLYTLENKLFKAFHTYRHVSAASEAQSSFTGICPHIHLLRFPVSSSSSASSKCNLHSHPAGVPPCSSSADTRVRFVFPPHVRSLRPQIDENLSDSEWAVGWDTKNTPCLTVLERRLRSRRANGFVNQQHECHELRKQHKNDSISSKLNCCHIVLSPEKALKCFTFSLGTSYFPERSHLWSLSDVSADQLLLQPMPNRIKTSYFFLLVQFVMLSLRPRQTLKLEEGVYNTGLVGLVDILANMPSCQVRWKKNKFQTTPCEGFTSKMLDIRF